MEVFGGSVEVIPENISLFTALRDLLRQTQIRRESRRTRGGCALLSLFYEAVETITLWARCKLETSHPIKLMAGSAQKPLTPGSTILM